MNGIKTIAKAKTEERFERMKKAGKEINELLKNPAVMKMVKDFNKEQLK
ncbi:MAG TPA: hypothetical protein VJK05_06030 [archaeon]|nr:hypothetical protein [archaeon]